MPLNKGTKPNQTKPNDETSSITEQGSLDFTQVNTFGKVINPTILPPSMGK